MEDYKDSDYKLLSLKSGIPAGEIDNALAAYGKLFPFNGGWFKEGNSNSNITILKMMCVPFMGIGVNMRIRNYSTSKDLSDLKLTGNHTHNDLVAWNNMTVSILS